MNDDRKLFSSCSFMENVYIIGGLFGDFMDVHELATCFQFYTKNLDWKEISRMNNARTLTARYLKEEL